MYKRSFKDFFRNRKSLYIFFAIALISISTLTIVYAALSVTLNITGTADISSASWDVHLDNVNVNTQSVSGNAPTIIGGTTATFSTKLEVPGDFYEFTIDVVNDGSIDAMIESIVKTPTLTTAQAKYLKYEVEYQNGESINIRQLVKKNSFVRLKVRLEFRKDVTADILPTTAETLNLSFTVVYAQSDGTGNNVMDGGVTKAKVVSGDYDTVGSEICIQEECFYVISSDETSVTMLAKYNLYVGGEWDASTYVYSPYGIEATGIQDENMKGWTSAEQPRIGTATFSNTTYWYSSDLKSLKSEYGTSYPAYVYDSNSTLYGYVENYKIYLSTLGVTPSEARLISYEELSVLGCNGINCSAASSWVISTAYWTGSARSMSLVWGVYTNGNFNETVFTIGNKTIFGVRPVIVISKDYF